MTNLKEQLDRATNNGIAVSQDAMLQNYRTRQTIFYIVKGNNGFWCVRDTGSKSWDVIALNENVYGDKVFTDVKRGEAMRYCIDEILKL